ncbi:MAG: ClbS/DfsB family four-helix bundle protein [Chloroflexota bacterium]
MSRPTTKEQLKEACQHNFKELFALINSLTKEQQEQSFVFEDRDKNIRDVLVHLHEWHQLFTKWVKANQSGNRINFLPEPYNWKNYPLMNIELWKKHQNTPLDQAKSLLENSHSETMKLVDSFSNEELFTKQYFPWTGTTSLGSYSVGSTSSHYDWAIKKIKKHILSLKKS